MLERFGTNEPTGEHLFECSLLVFILSTGHRASEAVRLSFSCLPLPLWSMLLVPGPSTYIVPARLSGLFQVDGRTYLSCFPCVWTA